MTTPDDLVALVLGGGRAAAAGDGGAVDAALDALAVAAGRGGRRSVDTAVDRVLTHVLAAMWEGGWQPAEAVRAVRRGRTGRHAELAATAVAAEESFTRRGTAPPLWSAQLEAVGAARWWSPDATWLSAWAERSGGDWLAALAVALETLGVLLPLPKVEVLLPPPSAWGNTVWIAPGDGRSDDPILAKVRALLAKAESTSFEAEAEALTAKAQELMSRHAIDDLLARGSAAADGPSARRIPVDDPYADTKSLLLQVVADANGVRCVWQPDLAVMTAVGFAGEVEGVDTLFTSLLVQATHRMLADGPARDRRGRSQTRSYRQSFLLAFATRIGERLAEAAEDTRRTAEQELSVSLLPVLARRQEEVDDAVRAMFPRLARHRTRSATNREGWDAGRDAADRASLDDGPGRLGRSAGG